MDQKGLSRFITGNPRTKTPRTKTKRCGKCGFTIRSKQHDEGQHHQIGKSRTYAPPKQW